MGRSSCCELRALERKDQDLVTDQDIVRNLRAVAHAVAQQELEGLTVPTATANDLRRVARGELSMAEALRNVYARFGDVPVFEP
jgi:hypothetical protein